MRSAVFGVEIETTFRFPGLTPVPASAGEPTRLVLSERRAILDGWPAGSERQSVLRGPDNRVLASWDLHPEGGWLVRAVRYGLFRVDADGKEVACAPVRTAAWRWQRYLVGQILPLLSMVRGHEVFHAAVLSDGARALAIIGPSRGGKSTLAAGLVLGGMRYLADDVLALRPGPVLVAEPGVGLTSVRHEPAALLGPERLARLGRRVGSDDDAIRLAVDLDATPRPLEQVYVIERDRSASGTTIESLHPVDPRLLLASSYNFVVRDHGRLVRQLDVCAGIAAGASCHRVRIGPDSAPDDTVAALQEHLR